MPSVGRCAAPQPCSLGVVLDNSVRRPTCAAYPLGDDMDLPGASGGCLLHLHRSAVGPYRSLCTVGAAFAATHGYSPPRLRREVQPELSTPAPNRSSSPAMSLCR